MSFKEYIHKNKPIEPLHMEDRMWLDGVHGLKHIVTLLHELHDRVNNSHSIASLSEDEEHNVQQKFERISELYKDVLPGVLNKIGASKSLHKPIIFYVRHSDDDIRVEMPDMFVQGIINYVEHEANEDIKSVRETDAVRNREKKKSEIVGFFKNNRNQIRILTEIYNTIKDIRYFLTHKIDVVKDIGDKQPNWNRLLKEDVKYIVSDFIQYCQDYLHLPSKPKTKIVYDSAESEKQQTFGHFTPSTGEIVVYADGRHIVDVLRTLAHEIVHFAQSHETADLDGSTGSPHENDANTRAGIILRNYQRMNASLFNTQLDKPQSFIAEAKFTQFIGHNNSKFLVHHSPVASTMRAIVDKAKPDKHGFKQVRAITDPEGKLHAWDGYDTIHHHVANALGHNHEYTTHWLDVKGKQYNVHSMAGGSTFKSPGMKHSHEENGNKFHDLVDKALKPHGYEHTHQWADEKPSPETKNTPLTEAEMRSLDSDYSIPRKEMPQIAAADHKDFIYHLKQHGVLSTHENVPVHTLNPTQKNFDAEKVRKMKMSFAADPEKPILISRDNDILDGHHRWKKLLDHNPQTTIRAIRLNTNTPHAIELARNYPKAFFKQ